MTWKKNMYEDIFHLRLNLYFSANLKQITLSVNFHNITGRK